MFYKGEPVLASLLEEVYFWRTKTLLVGEDGRQVVVFSYDDWSNVTGFTRRQIQGSFERYKNDGVITTYNARHPIKKTIIKALHVQLSDTVFRVFDSLISGKMLAPVDGILIYPPGGILIAPPGGYIKGGHTLYIDKGIIKEGYSEQVLATPETIELDKELVLMARLS